jgi:predicted dehydrogenase
MPSKIDSDMKAARSRRTFLRTSAATAVSVSAAATAKGPHERIKIGQLGTKHAHARGKLETILKLSNHYELVGIAEPDAAQQKALSNRYPNLPWMTEESLLQKPGLQVVAVETVVNNLVPTGLRCLRAGLHIHLDKPAGESLEACKALHAEATHRKLTVQMGYMLRYNPAFAFLFQVLRDGWLGEITEVSGMMGKKMGASGRKGLAEFEGGGMFELACHLIDAVVSVLGPPRRVQSFSHRSYPAKDSFADNQLAVFDYPKAIATIRCNHIDPLGGARRQFSVTGTQGTCEIRPLEPPKLRLGLDRPRGKFQKGFQDVVLPKSGGRYDGEFLDFARVIRGEQKLAWDAAHDLAVHEAVLRGCGMMK